MLSDLDELVLTCHDPRSKAYIKESVECYKAGAYRASVVSCWIAVAFALVDKIRELAATGDKAAQEQAARFERIQNSHDIPGALSFEKELPDMALKKFEFISHLEHQDLVRLVEDRNRCAHPSQVSDTQVFEASAELARLHIYNSIKSILSQPITQGKSSLERIMQDMDSRYFPSKAEDVYAYLNEGPLRRPKVALYRNFLQITTKTITTHEMNSAKRFRALNSLLAMKKMHPILWQSEFPNALQKIIENITNENDLGHTILFVIVFNKELNAWDYLSPAQKLRMSSFILNSPTAMIGDLDIILDLTEDHPLNVAAKERIKKTNLEELKSTTWVFYIPAEAFERTLELYAQSKSFAEANDIGKLLKVQISELLNAKPQLDKLIKIAKKNDQVKNSNEFVQILKAFAAQPSIGFESLKERLGDFELEIEDI